jgi:hypothetical protein
VIRCCGLLARPSRDFVPAADLLSWAPKKVGKETAPEKPPTRAAGGCSRYSKTEAPRETPAATPWSDSHAESVNEARCARGLGLLRSRRFQRGAPKQPNSQQPNSTTERCGLFPHPPFEPAEERQALRPCAQRTSTSDSAWLFDRSVAQGVPRGASRTEPRREPRCEAEGRAVRGRLFAFFLVAQKEGRPPGRRPGMGLAI